MTNKKDVIGYNNDDKNVFNSVGGLYGDVFEDMGFVKDPEKLVHQYDNLVRSLGRYYGKNLSDLSEREELFSYTAESLLRLIIEYDIYSPVDFPGYIDRKLKDRVKFSHIQKKQNKSGRIVLLDSSELDVSDLMDYYQAHASDARINKRNKIDYLQRENVLDDSLWELLDELNREKPLTQLDKAIITLLSTGNGNKHEIVKTLDDYLKDVDYDKISNEFDNIKTRIAHYYRAKNALND